jgi:electron transport complex protein RnfB
MAVVAIDLTACINCGWCRRVCPTETIKYFSTRHRTHIVEPDGCIDCGICVPVCPVNCIDPVPEYSVAPEKLEVAKAKARVFAANQRKMKQQREAVARRTLEALAARSATRA